MTTFEHLDRWLAAGEITVGQHVTISALARKQRLSVFVELNALLYLGVLSLAGGFAWTASAYSGEWGAAAILLPAAAVLGGCLYYCFSRVAPYSAEQVPPPSLVFDYVLYLGCLVFAVELGYVEYRFHLLQADWNYYLLASALVYMALAYRFDNRFVLSLGIATLGSWFGVRFSPAATFFDNSIRVSALAYGGIVAAVGVWLHGAGIKGHFLETYLHVAANVLLAALVSGVVASYTISVWLLGLLAASGAVIVGGVRFRRFAFVVYGVVYGYVGLSREVLRGVWSVTAALSYVVISAAAVIVCLVALSRRFGREE